LLFPVKFPFISVPDGGDCPARHYVETDQNPLILPYVLPVAAEDDYNELISFRDFPHRSRTRNPPTRPKRPPVPLRRVDSLENPRRPRFTPTPVSSSKGERYAGMIREILLSLSGDACLSAPSSPFKFPETSGRKVSVLCSFRPACSNGGQPPPSFPFYRPPSLMKSSP